MKLYSRKDFLNESLDKLFGVDPALTEFIDRFNLVKEKLKNPDNFSSKDDHAEGCKSFLDYIEKDVIKCSIDDIDSLEKVSMFDIRRTSKQLKEVIENNHLSESLDKLFDYNETKEICTEFDDLWEKISDILKENPSAFSDDQKDMFDEITEFYIANTNTTYGGVNSGKITLDRVKADLDCLKGFQINESLDKLFDYNEIEELSNKLTLYIRSIDFDEMRLKHADLQEYYIIRDRYPIGWEEEKTPASYIKNEEVSLSQLELDVNKLKMIIDQYEIKEINEGLLQTLKDSLPKIKIPSGNLWPSFISDIKSGKIKRDTLGGLLPQVVKDIASGKLKDDALSDFLPPVIEDIKSGKMKREMMDSLPPQFVKDVRSGKVTADIIGKRPEILGKIKDMFI